MHVNFLVEINLISSCLPENFAGNGKDSFLRLSKSGRITVVSDYPESGSNKNEALS